MATSSGGEAPFAVAHPTGDPFTIRPPARRRVLHSCGSSTPSSAPASPDDRVERAARTLRHALTADDPDVWADVVVVWRARLTLRDRLGLAFSTLRSLPEDERRAVAAHAIGGAGRPLPPFLDVEADAAWWADLADRAERLAYVGAAFERLSPYDQRAFLDHARRAKR